MVLTPALLPPKLDSAQWHNVPSEPIRGNPRISPAVEALLTADYYTTSGPQVQGVQRAINVLTLSGTIGADEVWGPDTHAKLSEYFSNERPVLSLESGYPGDAATRGEVKTLQRALNAMGATLTVDGKLGPDTEKALIAWQESVGETVPERLGRVDAQTWGELFGALASKLTSRERQIRAVATPQRNGTGPQSTLPVSSLRGFSARNPGTVGRVSESSGDTSSTSATSAATTALPGATATFDPQAAYDTLLPQLTAVAGPAEQKNLDAAVRRFVTAYANFTEQNPGAVKGRYAQLSNYGVSNGKNGRSYIIDMQTQQLVRGPMPMAHGSGHFAISKTLTQANMDAAYGDPASAFSNGISTNRSSLGVFTTFPLKGNHEGSFGGESYSRVRVGLDGHSVGYNDQARTRGVYMHGIPWMGRTQGCPGFTDRMATSADGTRETDTAAVQRLLESQASFVFHDAPVRDWVAGDRWLNS